MKKVLARAGIVLAVAGAVVAPQVHWLVLSPDRYALTAVDVEAAAVQQYTEANALHLDRIKCQPVRSVPGTSRCEAQEDDQVFGLVLELDADGGGQLFAAEAGELPVWSGD